MGARKTVPWTDRAISCLPIPEPKFSRSGAFYSHRKIAGLGVRIYPNGTKTFIYRGRHRGRDRRFSIGAYPTIGAKAAEQRAKEIAGDIARGRTPEAPDRNRATTLGELWTLMSESPKYQRLAERTRSEYSRIWTSRLSRYGHVEVDSLTTAEVMAWMDTWTRTAAVQANRILTLLSRILKFGRQRGVTECRAVGDVERNPETPREFVYTEDEVDAIVRYCEGLGLTNFSVVVRILATGSSARRGEVCAARWEEVIWTDDGAQIVVPRAKSNKRESIYLPPEAAETLSQWHAVSGKPKEGWVFPARSGSRRPHFYSLDKQFKAMLKELGIDEEKNPHDLRATSLTELASDGVDMHKIKAVARHRSTATTDRYIRLANKVADDTVREAAARRASKRGRKAVANG